MNIENKAGGRCRCPNCGDWYNNISFHECRVMSPPPVGAGTETPIDVGIDGDYMGAGMFTAGKEDCRNLVTSRRTKVRIMLIEDYQQLENDWHELERLRRQAEADRVTIAQMSEERDARDVKLDALRAQLATADKDRERMKENFRWIPVTERKPQPHDMPVLTIDREETGMPSIVFHAAWFEDHNLDENEITHWFSPRFPSHPQPSPSLDHGATVEKFVDQGEPGRGVP